MSSYRKSACAFACVFACVTLWSKFANKHTNRGRSHLPVHCPSSWVWSSPAIFTAFAHATKFIMLKRGVTTCEHYLYDFITVGSPLSNIGSSNLDKMLKVCEYVAFGVNPHKVILPTTPVIEFLTIIVHSQCMELRISNDKLASVLKELHTWKGRKWASKWDLAHFCNSCGTL